MSLKECVLPQALIIQQVELMQLPQVIYQQFSIVNVHLSNLLHATQLPQPPLCSQPTSTSIRVKRYQSNWSLTRHLLNCTPNIQDSIAANPVSLCCFSLSNHLPWLVENCAQNWYD